MSYISLRPSRRQVFIAVIGTCFLLSTTSSVAAPTDVNLRVEGSTTTLFEGVVTTDTNKPDGEHVCTGPSPTSAAYDMAQREGIAFDASWFGFDYAISQLGPDTSNGNNWWNLWVNNEYSNVGGCQEVLNGSDTTLWFYGGMSFKGVLSISAPSKIEVAKTYSVNVTKHTVSFDGQWVGHTTATPAEGATVVYAGQTVTTGSDGKASVALGSEGSTSFKANLPDYVRSNSATTCVYVPGSGFCDNVGAAAQVQIDNIAPSSRILWPSKKRYRRGPHILKGYVEPDPSGLKGVKIRLRRKTGHKGRRCRGFNFKRERFSVRCNKAAYKKVGNKSSWSYQLPKALGPGLYRLDVKAIDGAGNVSKLSFGQSRVHFRVLNRRK